MTLELTTEKEVIKEGIDKTVEAIASTMGAAGRLVAISDTDGDLRFTKDGVSVAKAIELNDPIENIGAQLVINSAQKTVDECGDGTTSTSVLLKAFCDLDVNPRDLEPVIERVIKTVRKYSNKVEKVSQIQSIASISANSSEIGDLIAEVYEKVGFDSSVTLELDETSYETYYEVESGIEFNSGYISSYFANQPNKNCIFHDPVVIIDEEKLSNLDKYAAIFNKSLSTDTPIVIISPDFSKDVKQMAVVNKQKKGLQVCLIKAPGYGKQIQENYSDIFALCNDESKVKKIAITPTTFSITPAVINDIDERIEELKNNLEGYVEDYDKVKIPQRIHALQGTAATIYVGETTFKNASELYDRIEDALGSVKAAIKSGYVEGSGMALCKSGVQADQFTDIFTAPLFQIQTNANIPNDLVARNVKTKEQVDLIEAGIIDPTDVVINSLNNAFASYKLFYNTKHIIHNEAKSPFRPLS